jgi:hypothetical protein
MYRLGAHAGQYGAASPFSETFIKRDISLDEPSIAGYITEPGQWIRQETEVYER